MSMDNSHCGKQNGNPSPKENIESYNPALQLLGIYPKKTKTLLQKAICTLVLIAALFMGAGSVLGKPHKVLLG